MRRGPEGAPVDDSPHVSSYADRDGHYILRPRRARSAGARLVDHRQRPRSAPQDNLRARRRLVVAGRSCSATRVLPGIPLALARRQERVMTGRLRRLIRETAGANLVEAALVTPLLLL